MTAVTSSGRVTRFSEGHSMTKLKRMRFSLSSWGRSDPPTTDELTARMVMTEGPYAIRRGAPRSHRTGAASPCQRGEAGRLGRRSASSARGFATSGASLRACSCGLTRKELKVKYKNSSPRVSVVASQPGVDTARVLRRVPADSARTVFPYFAIYLISGILVWNLFSNCACSERPARW